MTFKPGHKYERPKASIIGMKNIAIEVRESVPASVFVQWHMMIASGERPRLDLTTDPPEVVIAENTMKPSSKEQTDSINWLADRGHGLAAQHIVLEAELKAHVTAQSSALPTRGLDPALVAGLARLLRSAKNAPIDVEAVERRQVQLAESVYVEPTSPEPELEREDFSADADAESGSGVGDG